MYKIYDNIYSKGTIREFNYYLSLPFSLYDRNGEYILNKVRHDTKFKLLIQHPQIDINKLNYNILFNDPSNKLENLLIYTNLDVNKIYGPSRKTILFCNDSQKIKLLINYPNLNINHRDVHGKSALFYATDDTSVEYLLTHPKINVNIRDNRGKTALFYLPAKCIYLLIKHPKINVNIKDCFGKTALFYLYGEKLRTLCSYNAEKINFLIEDNNLNTVFSYSDVYKISYIFDIFFECKKGIISKDLIKIMDKIHDEKILLYFLNYFDFKSRSNTYIIKYMMLKYLSHANKRLFTKCIKKYINYLHLIDIDKLFSISNNQLKKILVYLPSYEFLSKPNENNETIFFNINYKKTKILLEYFNIPVYICSHENKKKIFDFNNMKHIIKQFNDFKTYKMLINQNIDINLQNNNLAVIHMNSNFLYYLLNTVDVYIEKDYTYAILDHENINIFTLFNININVNIDNFIIAFKNNKKNKKLIKKPTSIDFNICSNSKKNILTSHLEEYYQYSKYTSDVLLARSKRFNLLFSFPKIRHDLELNNYNLDIAFNINSKYKDYTSFLCISDLESTKILLKHPDIDVNLYDEYNDPVLFTDEIDKIKLLLQHPNINVNIQNNVGRTALFYSNVKITELLLQQPNIDVNIQDNDGDTALFHVRSDNMKLLLQHPNIDVNIQNNNGHTALFSQNLTLLLQHPNIDVNIQDNDGCTALFHVNPGNIKLLLQHPNIDVNIKNNIEETFLYYMDIDLITYTFTNFDIPDDIINNYFLYIDDLNILKFIINRVSDETIVYKISNFNIKEDDNENIEFIIKNKEQLFILNYDIISNTVQNYEYSKYLKCKINHIFKYKYNFNTINKNIYNINIFLK